MTKKATSSSSVQLSNPNKVFWPDEGYTKLDLARFYAQVFPRLRPYVDDRLLSLERCPDGLKGSASTRRRSPRGCRRTRRPGSIQHEKGIDQLRRGRQARDAARARQPGLHRGARVGRRGRPIRASPTGSASTWIRTRGSSPTRPGRPSKLKERARRPPPGLLRQDLRQERSPRLRADPSRSGLRRRARLRRHPGTSAGRGVPEGDDHGGPDRSSSRDACTSIRCATVSPRPSWRHTPCATRPRRRSPRRSTGQRSSRR